MSKIIDFERKGNVVRFYLGADDCSDYWGDDWNDAPYDCNAGTVYDQFVKGVKDVAFPFDSLVLEPSSEVERMSRYYSKKDMKNRVVPCLIIVPKNIYEEYYNERSISPYWYDTFSNWVGSDGITKIYFGDTEESIGTKNNKIYAVRDESTGKLVSNLTNPRKKYWNKRGNAENAIRNNFKYKPKLKLVTFELVEVLTND